MNLIDEIVEAKIGMHHGTAVAKCKVFRDDLGAKTKTLYEKEFVKLRDVTMG